jgi:2,3-dihydroxyphenylpropionate 1,2-dioxygenase
MMSTVVGGAMLPHAHQFFTMPDTEDKAVVEQFFHTTAPPFTIHVGGEARGAARWRRRSRSLPGSCERQPSAINPAHEKPGR